MRKISLLIILILFSVNIYAAPYRCDNGLVFSELSVCNSICGTCTELEADYSGLQVCDTAKYRGFVYSQGKTYALTRSSVFFDAEKTAVIGNADLNLLLSKILKNFGIVNAWIGASDKSRSNNFNTVDASRFTWRDNFPLTYSNWATGQPDNKLNGSDIGNTSIYGEHWALMRHDGYWHDTGARGASSDNYLEKYPSLVQFDSKLACVSGKDAADSNSALAQEVCGNSSTCMACVDPNADLESFDSNVFKKCIEGYKFDPSIGTGNLAAKSYICPVNSQQCRTDEECPAVPSGASLNIDLAAMQCQYAKITSQTACANGYVEINGVCTARLSRDAVCPTGNNPCVQSNRNEDKFYCSPTECADITDTGSFVDDGDEYTGDQQDAGFDADGNCMGQIYLFAGESKNCRLRSIKNPLINCCQSNSAWKPRFRCNDTGSMYEDAGKCGEICGKPCDLLKKQPPDLKLDMLGVISLDLCKAEEKELAFRRSMFPQGGNCKYIGTRCTERWKFGFGSVCVQKKETYCCFQTPLAKIIMQAAHDQLGISWGGAGSPNCRGITPDEFSKINLDNVDFSAWIENYVLPAVGTQAQDLLKRMQLP